MNRKNDRHTAIRELIESRPIASQQELLEALQAQGFAATQATLSRDLLALRVMRIPDPVRGYLYAMPGEAAQMAVPGAPADTSPLHGCRSLAFSGNLAVLKSLPSFAPSIGLLIDSLMMQEIVGTVAGDDTLLIVLPEGLSHERFRQALLERLPELRIRL
ncbi:MAG TPA: ArgR family transcriptional regulator [bacterium]|nr:ArgR family transcriptional regulator [bacterium]HQI47096.1 ArgR family transcriptional regulator [bacterium]HQJ65347.1 ArgR family transcriptional regulator [bacterium]